MKHVKVFEDFLNENFKPFSDLEFAIDQHEKDNHVYDLTKIVNIFNQLSSADQLKARKKYGDKFFPKLNEETADNGDTLGELNDMTLGQLERIGDYAKMIKDRMMKGEKLESWMYSQLTIALENLNSVHDAMDGNDGTIEESRDQIGKMYVIKNKKDLADAVKYLASQKSHTYDWMMKSPNQQKELEAWYQREADTVRHIVAQAKKLGLTDELESLTKNNSLYQAAMQELNEREVSSAEREKLADKGFALPNGSYPIANVEDLKNAVSAFGRSNPEDRKEVAQHIAKRAKALGKEDLIPQTEIFQKALKESVEEINEAKLNRDQMMEWIGKSMKFVRTTEDFNGSKGGIWVSGENGDTFKGKPIYDYYAEGSAYELGVLAAWEKELNNRGWYSEWNDAGTVMIWPE